jgi:hypothetical protein
MSDRIIDWKIRRSDLLLPKNPPAMCPSDATCGLAARTAIDAGHGAPADQTGALYLIMSFI